MILCFTVVARKLATIRMINCLVPPDWCTALVSVANTNDVPNNLWKDASCRYLGGGGGNDDSVGGLHNL